MRESSTTERAALRLRAAGKAALKRHQRKKVQTGTDHTSTILFI